MEETVVTITGESHPRESCIQGFTIRDEVQEVIRQQFPDFNKHSWILKGQLKAFKLKYLSKLAGGNLEIATQVAGHQTISDDMLRLLKVPETNLLTGVADWLSSHRFGVLVAVFVLVWVVYNSGKGFDPYPFNLLDLTLGFIAIMQSLFIMMGQSKSQERERMMTVNNYKLSLKNEVEITVLREKIDHLKDNQVPDIFRDVRLIKSILQPKINVTDERQDSSRSTSQGDSVEILSRETLLE